jgi:hypothetical protein
MVGYPTHAPGYRVYNPETRRITTSVHIVFQEDTPGFGAQVSVDSAIIDPSDDAPSVSPQSHSINTTLPDPLPPTLRRNGSPRLRLPLEPRDGVL